MTRPKTPRNYQTEIVNLSGPFDDDPKLVLEVPFETMEDALSFRLSFYSFRSATLNEMQANKSSDAFNYFPSLEHIVIKIKDDPPRLVVKRRDQDGLAERIAEAIRIAKEKLNE